MNLGKVFLFLLCLFLFIPADSRPAHRGVIALEQPDGSTFRAIFRGDEFIRIKTTEQGHAIVQDEDGWWCYAIYGQDGEKKNSGYRVMADCPADVLGRSRDIPYRRLSELSARRRSAASEAEEIPLLKRIRDRRGMLTRADDGEAITKHGIVVLAEFADLSFKHTKDDFEKMLNQDGYSLNGATGCAREYFDSQFNGKVRFSFDVSDVVTLPNNPFVRLFPFCLFASVVTLI